MSIYFIQEADTGRAVWCSSEGAEEVVLCSVNLVAYESEAAVRDRFGELINAVADHCRRQHVAGAIDPAAWVDELPCSKCDSPLAADVLHRARQASGVSELDLSPGGFPAGCCKRRVVGAFGGRPDTLHSAARR
jgi:hypothetical protein